MSEYELADLAKAAMGNFLTSFTVFVSIVTAYVIAAFTAGKRLTRFQVTIVNGCFLLASGAMGLLSVLIFQVFLERARARRLRCCRAPHRGLYLGGLGALRRADLWQPRLHE